MRGRLGVEQVDLEQPAPAGTAAAVAAREVVEHGDLVARREQLLRDDVPM